MQYSPKEKAAISRLFSDLIKSDRVITAGELDSFARHCGEFGVGADDRTNGDGMSLQEAFETIAAASSEKQKAVAMAMETRGSGIAMADNECCREEAMLIVAFRYAISGKSVRVYSIPLRNRPIMDTQIVFLENPSPHDMRYSGDVLGGDGRRLELVRQISDIVEAAGFELIYIPEIRDRLCRWDEGGGSRNLERVLSLIAPSVPESRLSLTTDSLRGMTTRRFYEDVLCSPAGLDMPLEITEPSWMIRLNDSSIGGVGYANYLTIPLSFGKDLPREERDVQIREQVAGFISELNELQGPYYIQVNRHRRMGEDFQYGGFYKILFDALLNRREQEWTLTIHAFSAPRSAEEGKRCQLFLRENGKTTGIPLVGREAAFYVLLLCMKDRGGLDTNDRALMQRLFDAVYVSMCERAFSDGRRAPDISKSQVSFRQVKHRVMRGLAAMPPSSIHDMDIIAKGNILSVNTDLSHVRIRRSGAQMSLVESDLYRAIGAFIEKCKSAAGTPHFHEG